MKGLFLKEERSLINVIAERIGEIAERKRAEEELDESHALLRIAGETAKLGGWSVNLEENRVSWSDEVAAIHEMPAGYSPLVEEGISFYTPEWREKITKCFGDCAQEAIPYNEEMEIITANGKRVWVQSIGEAVRDDQGKIIKVQGAFQDITGRKQAEEALRREKDFAESLIQTAQAIVLVLDTKGHIVSINPYMEDISGYSLKEVQGKDWCFYVST